MNKNIILLIVFSISLILQVQTIIIVSDFVYAPHIGNQRCTGIGENSYIYPGIRSYAMSWFISEDFVNQYIYVFGGLGYDENDEASMKIIIIILNSIQNYFSITK